MRFTVTIIASLALLLAGWPNSAGAAEDDDQQTRGLFIKSRPASRSTQARRPKSSPASPSDSTAGHPAAERSAVGLGFSMYKIGDRGSVRVDTRTQLREGDALRFVVEPSIDGFLYIFVGTNDELPVMIYPDSRLADGDNYVVAHSITEVPSRRNPALSVFKLQDSPATEHVFLVVTRDPLEGVPIAGDLVALCAQGNDRCPWAPGPKVWDVISMRSSAPVRESTRADAGQQLSSVEDEALTRKIVLSAADNQPSVIAMCSNTEDAVLVRSVTIRHVK